MNDGSNASARRGAAATGTHHDPLQLEASDTSLERAIRAAIRSRGAEPADLIEVLHAIQPLDGHLSRRSLHQVACDLRLPLSHVYGVASFYHLFSRIPPVRHRLAVCGGTACFVNGASHLHTLLAERLALPGLDGRNGDWELVASGCLAACGGLPVLSIDDGPAVGVAARPGEALQARLQELGVPELGVPELAAELPAVARGLEQRDPASDATAPVPAAAPVP